MTIFNFKTVFKKFPVKYMIRDIKTFLLIVALLGVSASVVAQPYSLFKPLNPNDPKGLGLGSGVPRSVDAYGNVIGIDPAFTTGQFHHAALLLMLREAGAIARQLQLPESLPITETNLIGRFVAPFGFYYSHHIVGNICTTNYAYIFAEGNKFSGIDVANYDATCLGLEKTQLPVSQLDFKTPYQLATQWMAAVSIDINGLNNDCDVQVAVSPYWNGLTRIGEIPRKKFVPIYDVSWLSSGDRAEHRGDVAFLELYLPTKKLIQFSIQNPRYILRQPLVFTNLSSLFPGTARITVFTNRPVETIHGVVPP